MGEHEREYGPFHRVRSPTQSDKVACEIEVTGELWGRKRRGGAEPVVQAYVGSLGNQSGVEFFTLVEPYKDTPPGHAQWRIGMRGVRHDGDFAKIAVRVTRNSQVEG